MPVQHMVWIEWKAGTPAERVAFHLSELESLRDLVPGIRHLSVGNNFTTRARNFTHGLLVTFDSPAALDAYQKHPRHVAVATALRADAADVMALDYEESRAPS